MQRTAERREVEHPEWYRDSTLRLVEYAGHTIALDQWSARTDGGRPFTVYIWADAGCTCRLHDNEESCFATLEEAERAFAEAEAALLAGEE